MELEKKYPECGNLDLERQTQYVLTHKWILDIKQSITRLLYTTPVRLGKKKEPKRDTIGGIKEGKIIKFFQVNW